jgi:hypothetical protein
MRPPTRRQRLNRVIAMLTRLQTALATNCPAWAGEISLAIGDLQIVLGPPTRAERRAYWLHRGTVPTGWDRGRS